MPLLSLEFSWALLATVVIGSVQFYLAKAAISTLEIAL
jgi:hypothetical protein